MGTSKIKVPFTEIEAVYHHIGANGRAQSLYLVITTLLNVAAAMNFLMAVFLLITPEWKCHDTSQSCTLEDICGDMSRDQWSWVNKEATMISQFDLQCDMTYAYLASSLFFIPGTVVGLILSGYLSDRYGRKKTVLLSLGVSLVNTIGQAFATSFPMFLVFRTFMGLSCIGFQAVHLTYRDEFYPASERPLCNFIGAIGKSIGFLLLPAVFYFADTWRALNLASSVCLVICFLIVIIPESPQWLLANRSPDAAAEVLYKLAKMNGVELQKGEIMLKVKSETKNESGNVLAIFRDRAFLIVTMKFLYQWFVTSLMFYGFYYSLEAISGSVSANFAIMGVLDIPFNGITAYFLYKLGRRNTLLLNLGIIMICCALSLIQLDFGRDWNLKRVATIIGSKWGVSSVFFIVYLYTNEVMPTSVRSTGLHLCSISARVGAFIAPYVVELCSKAGFYAQNILFLVLCAGGIVVGWSIPETKDKTLKTTLQP